MSPKKGQPFHRNKTHLNHPTIDFQGTFVGRFSGIHSPLWLRPVEHAVTGHMDVEFLGSTEMDMAGTWPKREILVDGWNPANHLGWCWNPINKWEKLPRNKIGAGFQPSTVSLVQGGPQPAINGDYGAFVIEIGFLLTHTHNVQSVPSTILLWGTEHVLYRHPTRWTSSWSIPSSSRKTPREEDFLATRVQMCDPHRWQTWTCRAHHVWAPTVVCSWVKHVCNSSNTQIVHFYSQNSRVGLLENVTTGEIQSITEALLKDDDEVHQKDRVSWLNLQSLCIFFGIDSFRMHSLPWAPKTMKNKGFGHLKTRLFTIKTSKNVGFGGPW